MSALVFVYGTLKRGGKNHEWIENQRFVATARTLPFYRMFDLGGYPGMVRSADGLAIQGEIWQVDGPGLARLDLLEDIEGGEYERVAVELVLPLVDPVAGALRGAHPRRVDHPLAMHERGHVLDCACWK